MKLFVYGTLQSSFENEMAVFLRENATFFCKGTVKGKLFLLGWYPGLMLDNTGIEIHGQVFEVYQNEELVLKRLDEYEGVEMCDFRRILGEVDTKYGNINCWLYESLIDSTNEIETGKFVAVTQN